MIYENIRILRITLNQNTVLFPGRVVPEDPTTVM